MLGEVCTVNECGRSTCARGLCTMHYQRWKKHGDVTRGHRTATERFYAKVEKTPGGCWLWTSSLNNKGYGMFSLNLKPVLAHRFCYEIEVGPIPDGLELDHLCRVPRCVNPWHLEPVTHAENVNRGNRWNKIKDEVDVQAIP